MPNRHKPKRLPTGYVAWLGVVHRATQAGTGTGWALG